MMRSISMMILAAIMAACGSNATDRTSNGEVTRRGGTSAVNLTDVDVRDYELNMDKVRKWVAGMDALMSAALQDSSVAAAIASSGNETTRQTIARLEANARARDILDRAGLSAKDYVMTM